MVKNANICAILERNVTHAGVAPAAAAGYVGASVAKAVGAAGWLPGGTPADTDTIFDLASVSKPVVACTLLRLSTRGSVDLQAPLGSLLPEARGSGSERLPVELFLAHRAGLDAHRALFAPLFEGRAVRRDEALRTAARARRPECDGLAPPAGFAPTYSDLGYILIGAVIEAVTAEPLDVVVEREVSLPLGLELGSTRQLRRRRASFERDVAPTEIVRARGGALRGVVHDENAWALSGHGCSGHAGLFGTVHDVLGFGLALLDALAGRSKWLSAEALAALVRPRPGGTLRAGFDGKSQGASSAGALSGPETFGHLGFTGTSLWCDPGAGAASVLLTNRVHPTRDNPKIRAARPLVH
ncbi:MAG TPA: serine hydrolase domain-containing protein, partial [Polyangiaceae bacterium]|nr:serine hydrolase domain-containing protein [Polyangiaceae bacterium]